MTESESRPNTVPCSIPTPNNMGVVRYVLALAVVVAHFNALAGYDVWFPMSSYSGVGGFFALSGFLIYGSYIRKPDLKTYLLSRARRILPAYWITVLFFAFVFGFISTAGIRDYFLSGEFWRYVGCNMAFLNFLQPTLPGVFGSFGFPDVNGSLWTMKVEWCLYLTPPVIAWLIRRLRVSPTLMFVLVYIAACGYRIAFRIIYENTEEEIYNILGRQFLGQLSYFYIGVLCRYWFDEFMRHKYLLMAGAAVLMLLCDYVPYGYILIHPLALSVMVVWFSMVGRWGTWEGKRDNISYNIYLMHFPVIQMFVYFRGEGSVSAAPAFMLCISVVWVLSWILNMVEIRIRRRLQGAV